MLILKLILMLEVEQEDKLLPDGAGSGKVQVACNFGSCGREAEPEPEH